MNSLPAGGTITRIACGSTTFMKLCLAVNPIARAASRWPPSTARMPARTISAM